MLDPNNTEDVYSYEKTRNIVSEILNFGVSQNEILKLIELLSLELEDRDVMLSIVDAIKSGNKSEEIIENLIFWKEQICQSTKNLH